MGRCEWCDLTTTYEHIHQGVRWPIIGGSDETKED